MTEVETVKPKNNRVINYQGGLIMSLIGALVTLTMYPYAFIKEYHPLILIEAAKGPEGCEENVTYFYPAFTDLGIFSGILFLVAAYGFYKKSNWALTFGVIASVLALKGSFWPMVPPMSNGLFPYYMYVFGPSMIVYFLMTYWAGRLSFSRIIYGLIAGMAMITSFMNTIAATNRILAVGAPDNALYVMTMRLNIVAGLAIGIVAVAVMIDPKKEWIKILALTAGLLELFVGGTVATAYSFEIGRISFFYLGPLFVTLMLIGMFTPKIWKLITD